MILSIIFFISSVFAEVCNDGHAKLIPSGLQEGGQQIVICREGTYSEPTGRDWHEFFPKVRRDADRWAPLITDGKTNNAEELLRLIGHNTDRVKVDNYSGREVSPQQTRVLNEIVAAWNKHMPQIPVKREKLLEAFRAVAEQNKSITAQLARPGTQCRSINGEYRGYQITFSDGEKMTIIPNAIRDLGNGRYEVEYYEKAFLRPLTSLQKRTVEVPQRGNIKWSGPKGNFEVINQENPQVTTSSMFSATMGANSGASSPLCNAERDVKRLYPQGTVTPAGTAAQ